ncbi:hypothetical protein ACP275_14G025900 [Erythranthe tilingii]
MDLMSQKPLHLDESKALSPITSPQISSPIIAIAMFGILSTCFFLIGYYVFVVKCYLNRTSHISDDPPTFYSPRRENQGLDASTIRSIPILEFKKVEFSEQKPYECAVCLDEFEEDEKIRVIPFCGHYFHVDCIDVWLHKNANCPICRTSVLAHDTSLHYWDQTIIHAHDQSPSNYDEEYVVIEIESQENSNSGELISSISSKDKFEKYEISRRGEKSRRVLSMGDECIHIRQKDEQFEEVNPIIRRSFSMDYCSNGRVKRSLFS